MLRDLSWPSDLKTEDYDPSVSAQRKIEIIKRSPVTVIPNPVDNDFELTLPYGPLLVASAPPRDPQPEDLYLWIEYLDICDAALFNQGFGSRLIRAAVRYAHSKSMPVDYVYGQGARLGSVNALIRVFGAEAVTLTKSEQNYGQAHGSQLDGFLADYPLVQGEACYVDSIRAQIDLAMAATWELPVAATSMPTD